MDPWESLREEARQFGVSLSEEKIEKFRQFYRLLLLGNEKMNLTRITGEEDVVTKHFIDSLSLFLAVDLPEKTRFVDVGTGAGFPGLPILIARPHWEGFLVESVKKKAGFLSEAVAELGLQATVLPERAEDLGRGKETREKFDLAVTRAVGDLSVLVELCLPLVKVGGIFVAYKGGEVEEEVKGARGAISKLGGTLEKLVPFELPGGAGRRTLVVIEKESSTPPDYPRQAGIPQRHKLR
ncbi:MAG TPA: 16S rRNA (guanine(527)-N(7))-methyltransferase RsmG [Cyanobacteria bacterium UBA8530]|nr:16S rRNA (guanine(527)-N(7))-methyltransferase RsmG [Cyanobacteria bacterium UBA8530]